jgi:hypothetical protein
VDRTALLAGAPDPGSAQLDRRRFAPERALECPQLGVGANGAIQFLPDEVGPFAAVSTELHHESPEITELELAQAAQVADPAADAAAPDEPRFDLM